jgi:hypothetical protein
VPSFETHLISLQARDALRKEVLENMKKMGTFKKLMKYDFIR